MGRRAKEKVATDPELIARIRRDLERWQPGLWAEELAYGPACICGAGARTLAAAKALGPGKPEGRCVRHPGGTVFREGEAGASIPHQDV